MIQTLISLTRCLCAVGAFSIMGGIPGAIAADDSPSLDELRSLVEASLPGVQLTSVADTPVDGLYELVVDGSIYYVDATGKFLVEGSLIELESRANLTEARLGNLHMALLEHIGEDNMLIYQPESPTGRSITVFTDISCGYCRRLHADLDQILDEGIAVRYLLFPRAGLGSGSHEALEDVWCNSDPQEAMTVAKAGGQVAHATCSNPIESHVALATQVGLRGTPLIYTDSGERIPGYREPAALVSMIKESEPYVAQ